MLEKLKRKPPDPILQLMLDCQVDRNPNKVDLSAGVYKEVDGNTPIMDCVRNAQQKRIDSETTKTYMGIAGDPRFNESVAELALGNGHSALRDSRLKVVQTPGGSGALRIAAELIADARPSASIWLSDPSWANHHALLGNSGLPLKRYPYYNRETHQLEFETMCEALQSTAEGDVVVLHGSCHNPCGADLSSQQWGTLRQLMLKRNLTPLLDVAYHGLSDELEADAVGWRETVDQLPEALLAYSCSKNFGIYRERAGALMVACENSDLAEITYSNMLSIVREIYSVPPAHGAHVVAEILTDSALRAQWIEELGQIRNRIIRMRTLLADALNSTCERDYSFVGSEKGMFSFLGLDLPQIEQLKNDFSVYVVDSSRISVAGVSEQNVSYIADAVAQVGG